MEEQGHREDGTVVSVEDQLAMFEMTTPEIGDHAYVVTLAMDVLAKLAMVRADLVALRTQRDQINANIKLRVAFEAQLARMARIADEVLKEVNNDGDQVPAGGSQDVLDQ